MDLNVGFQIGGAEGRILERVFQCPGQECERTFIARYERPDSVSSFSLRDCVPFELASASQSEIISKISPDFCSIYEQADKAEQHGLMFVAGPGYRKALEFLVKDYIFSRLTGTDVEVAAKKLEVEKTLLGSCIAKYISSAQIKEVAKRAAWLGNDETHYLRKWEGKDLKYLKKLITLTLHWIEMENLTAEVMLDMPAAKP